MGKLACFFPLPDGRRCLECASCQGASAASIIREVIYRDRPPRAGEFTQRDAASALAELERRLTAQSEAIYDALTWIENLPLNATDAVRDAVHTAVSFTYMDGEAPRLKARIALKEAMGWPLTDGELERLAELENQSVPDREG